MDRSLYTRPNKPKSLYVKPRRDMEAPTFDEVVKPVEIGAGTECHVTPQDIAARMAEYLELDFNNRVLEPSAGTGNLINAVLDLDRERNPVITAVEQHYSLVDALHARFNGEDVRINQSCFLEYANETDLKFNRIIMNPPFKKIKSHMNSAINLLAEDSKLIALVPITYQHDDAETLEELGSDTFANAKVNTKIILIEG